MIEVDQARRESGLFGASYNLDGDGNIESVTVYNTDFSKDGYERFTGQSRDLRVRLGATDEGLAGFIALRQYSREPGTHEVSFRDPSVQLRNATEAKELNGRIASALGIEAPGDVATKTEPAPVETPPPPPPLPETDLTPEEKEIVRQERAARVEKLAQRFEAERDKPWRERAPVTPDPDEMRFSGVVGRVLERTGEFEISSSRPTSPKSGVDPVKNIIQIGLETLRISKRQGGESTLSSHLKLIKKYPNFLKSDRRLALH